MLTVHTERALASTIGPKYGISDSELTSVRTNMKKHISQWLEERKKGEHAWTFDPSNTRVASQVQKVVKEVKAAKFTTVVWIGIGGSGLGPQVLAEMLQPESDIRFELLDSIDPHRIAQLEKTLDLKKTLVVVVSKSGGTLETMSAFFYFWDKLQTARKRKANQHVIGITDPRDGLLRKFCSDHDIQTLPIPPDVGGRYCIFTPVGLLTLALLGGDIDEFLKGAQDMDKQCHTLTLEENPAAQLAAMQYLLETKKQNTIRVIMPYIHSLASIGRWNQQLVAESLGKNEQQNPSPLAAQGTQDQHSLLQQWMQGPRRCMHLFICEEQKETVKMPTNLPEQFAYIEGKPFGQLLDACAEGTAGALQEAKRPSVTISMPKADIRHLGQLFFLFLTEVVLLGKLYRIDPYGQPGVETGKKLTKALLQEH